MKVIHLEKAVNFQNSEKCGGLDYPLGDPDINGAVIEIKGRYPDKNRVMNTKVKELFYIAEGSGKLILEGKEILLNKGDMAIIEPYEKYFWNGNFRIFMSCAPTWTKEQHQEVE